MENQQVIPEEITRVNEHDIKIIWKNGETSTYIARELRLKCQCAQCVEEMTGRKILNPDTVPQDVKPNSLKLVGRYAIQIWWSDGHSSGIYPFVYLRKLDTENKENG